MTNTERHAIVCCTRERETKRWKGEVRKETGVEKGRWKDLIRSVSTVKSERQIQVVLAYSQSHARAFNVKKSPGYFSMHLRVMACESHTGQPKGVHGLGGPGQEAAARASGGKRAGPTAELMIAVDNSISSINPYEA
jgi:hypothetical protein